MSRTKKLILYGILLALSLAVFILEIFVFQWPDGIAGLVICLLCIYSAIGSLIKLIKLSERFKEAALNILDLLFFLP